MLPLLSVFFSIDTATAEIYTLSLHDALPILVLGAFRELNRQIPGEGHGCGVLAAFHVALVRLLETRVDGDDPVGPRQLELERSEEHTSELQSLAYLVCRLLLEKKKYRQI